MIFPFQSSTATRNWIALLMLALLTQLAWGEPTQEELEAASRLAARATFGMSYEQVVAMAEQGLDEWLDEQLNMECTSFRDWEERMYEMYDEGEFDDYIEKLDVDLSEPDADDPAWELMKRFGHGHEGPFETIWYMATRYGEDQLCQRVAWALSQIFVIHMRAIENLSARYAFTQYYDYLVQNTFGNYRDLIEDITYSPQMGTMLSHLNNSKAREEERIFPDENYAREVMQLFSIGLFELNIDGTHKLDESGNTIPTYDSKDISEMARVMTGFYFGADSSFGDTYTSEFYHPMDLSRHYHDDGQKVILDDVVVPAGQWPHEDVSDALDAIHNHTNVGPFIGRQLIQRLVTSNPEPEYVQRVAEAFNDDGQGVRGNLKHVVKTILTYPDEKDPSHPEKFGKLREPMVRLMNLHRMFPTIVVGEDTRGLSEPFFHPYRQWYSTGGQVPLDAPSVFNFYTPFHSPTGTLAENGLVAPEFQIFGMLIAINFSDIIWRRLISDDIQERNKESNSNVWESWFVPHPYLDENGTELYWHPFLSHDISDYVELADNPADLVDRLDLVMAYGKLIESSRSRLIHRLGQISVRTGTSDEEADLRDRVWFAIWYMSSLPDYIVETH